MTEQNYLDPSQDADADATAAQLRAALESIGQLEARLRHLEAQLQEGLRELELQQGTL